MVHMVTPRLHAPPGKVVGCVPGRGSKLRNPMEVPSPAVDAATGLAQPAGWGTSGSSLRELASTAEMEEVPY
ncbi:hypothetical protein MHYP_G00021090 [Metynnis hypsauchen]